jgi:hypothetical protein
MTGEYERLAGSASALHRCAPPGWWRRWRDGVEAGAVWRCGCGRRYEYRPWEIMYLNVGRPGSDHHPWWLIGKLESPLPPRSRREER